VAGKYHPGGYRLAEKIDTEFPIIEKNVLSGMEISA
jgi:hypothetical protein